MSIIEHIPLLTELQNSGYLLSYKHIAPTELKLSLYRIDVRY